MELPEAIDKIRPTVVQIAFKARNISPDDQEKFGGANINVPIGTGFFVNRKGYVITANHVIVVGQKQIDEIEAEEKMLRIGIAQPNEIKKVFPEIFERKTIDWRAQFTFVDFDVIATDETNDLCLLKLEKNPFNGELTSGVFVEEREVPLLFGTAYTHIALVGKPKDGSAIAISGFPLNEPILYTSSGVLASTWHFKLKKSRFRIIPPDLPDEIKEALSYELEDNYWGDIHAFPGHSGSPVYLVNNAHIIGVCIAGRLLEVIDKSDNKDDKKTKLRYFSGITIIIPVYLVHRLLIENLAGWAPPDREEWNQR